MFKKVEKLKYRYNKETRELVLPMKLAKKDIFSIILKNTMTDIYRKGDRISITSKTVAGETSTIIKFPAGSDYDFVKKYGLDTHPIFLFEIPDDLKNEEAQREKEIAKQVKTMDRIANTKERQKKAEERKQGVAARKAEREQKKLEKEQERDDKAAEREAAKNHIGYRKANRIGKSKLTSLIRSRWENGEQGLMSSVGGAMSDKVRAMGVRTKRKFDPLNWVGGAAGMLPFIGGATRWAAVSGLGALFGRDPETIREFGGWARSKKDSKHTKIGPGQVRDLQSGDSSADILAKMYNFMLKDHERQKKEHELADDFKKEQEMESERRHQKLIEEIHKLVGGTPTEEPKKEEPKTKTFFDSILGGIKSIIGTVSSFAGFVKNIFTTGFGALKNMASAVGAIVEQVAGSIFGSIKTIITTVVTGALVGVTGYFSSKIKAITTLLGGIIRFVGNLPKGGILASAALSLYEFGPDLYDYMQGKESAGLRTEREGNVGKNSEDMFEKYYKEKRDLESNEQYARTVPDSDFARKQFKIEERTRNNEALKQEAIKAALQFQREKLLPQVSQLLMQYGDFKEVQPEMTKDGYPLLKFKSPMSLLGEKTIEQLVDMSHGFATVGEYIDKAGEMALKAGKEVMNSGEMKALQEKAFEGFKAVPTMIFKEIPEKKDDEEEHSSNDEPQNVSYNTNNTIGGQSKFSDITPISSRIKNDSIQLALARSTYAV